VNIEHRISNTEHRSICDIYKVRIIWFLLFALVVGSCGQEGIAERQIVLINSDTLDRADIAREIEYINALNPKVVALDIQFSEDRDPQKDTLLLAALKSTKRLFMISMIDDYDYGRKKLESYERFALGSLPVFLSGAETGFANTVLDEKEMAELNRFSTHEYVAGKIEYHFGVKIAMSLDSLRALQFVTRHPRVVNVDYRDGDRSFKVFQAADVLGKKISRQDIEGKIVMLGFLGPGNEDKFFTPLNTNPDEPDMYGMVYLAYVAAQVLENE